VDMPDLYEAILDHAAHHALSYAADMATHEHEMSERFRTRRLQWHKLGSYETKLNRTTALGNTPLRARQDHEHTCVGSDSEASSSWPEGAPENPAWQVGAEHGKPAGHETHREPGHTGPGDVGGCARCGDCCGEIARLRRQMQRMEQRFDELLAALHGGAAVAGAGGHGDATAAREGDAGGKPTASDVGYDRCGPGGRSGWGAVGKVDGARPGVGSLSASADLVYCRQGWG
jgi:hypothetical protein